jgi:hypothetical protein
MTHLKPGLPINLIVNTNLIRETNDIRTSIIHDIIGKKLIIAQTDPAISTVQQNDTITVSFLTDEKDNPARYGFQATIVDFIKEYQLSSSQTVPAIVVMQKSVPESYNLRTFYRIQPLGDIGLLMSIFGQPVSIMEISIGGAIAGASPNFDLEFSFDTGKTLKVTLTIDDEDFHLEAQIKRIFYPEDQNWGRDIKFVAMEFCGRTPELDRALGEKIISIQRELRSKGHDSGHDPF